MAKRIIEKCRKEGCHTPSNLSGFCPNHYRQMLKNADPYAEEDKANRSKRGKKGTGFYE